jgi:WD40 repeat protein
MGIPAADLRSGAVRLPLAACALALALCGPGLLFGGGQPDSAGGARAIIDSGHSGAVRWMEFDEKRGLLLTAGEDGTVRVWDPGEGGLLHTLHVTQLAAGRIAVNPAAAELAVVVGDGGGEVFLAVWDWERERQLYRVPLKEQPSFLRWSALGTYLLYGESSWQGLKILRASDGSPVTFHPEGFGIVGFAEMSRTEKTLMTYQVSGRITYWDVASGNQSVDVPTVPYLSGIRISQDRSVLVGFTDAEIVRVDAVTGAVRGRASAAGVRSLDISPAGDEIAVISGPGPGARRWAAAPDSLLPAPDFPQLPSPPFVLAYGSDRVYFSGASGALAALGSSGDVSTFGKNAVATLTGFDVGQGRIALGSEDWVRVLSSDWLDGASTPSSIHTLAAANPFSDAVGLTFLGDSRLLAWGSGTSAVPGLAVLDTSGLSGTQPAPAFVPLPSPFRAPLTDLRVGPEEFIGMEAGGTLRIADPSTGASRFDSRIPGAVAALRISGGEIVAARNASAGPQGSLIRLNMATGETVAIRDRNRFTYALLLRPGSAGKGPELYSIGVDAAGSTNLLRHDGPGFERETLIDHAAAEDLDAVLSFDPVQRVLYATLGRDRAVAWDGQSTRTLSLENSVPRRLLVRGGLAFAVNRDSTVTIADAQTGETRAQAALFSDGEWAIVFADGRYAASTGGDLHVRVFADGTPVKATEDYRLRIETR